MAEQHMVAHTEYNRNVGNNYYRNPNATKVWLLGNWGKLDCEDGACVRL